MKEDNELELGQRFKNTPQGNSFYGVFLWTHVCTDPVIKGGGEGGGEGGGGRGGEGGNWQLLQ